jgi:hypothetical protein
MSISTVQLFQRIGRRARGGDFTKLSLTEQTDLMEAANAALQRLYNALPTYFKVQTQGFVLPAPLTISGIGVTAFSKTVTGANWTSAQIGQTVALDGDAAWNQIIGANELLNPYMGATATVGGTVYGNAIYSETYPFDRVIGNPEFANQGLTPYGLRTLFPTSNGNNLPWIYAQNVGMPRVWWTQVLGNSQGGTPLMIIRVAPAPSTAYAINIRLSFWPKRLTLADYAANTALVVPDQFIETSLIPMALQEFMSSPAWQSRNDEGAVEARGERGEKFAREQPGVLTSNNNWVGTPAGF